MLKVVRSVSVPEDWTPSVEIRERHLRQSLAVWEAAGGDVFDGKPFTNAAIYRYAEALAASEYLNIQLGQAGK